MDTFPAFPSSTKWVTLSQKEIRLARQDLPFMNSGWLGLVVLLVLHNGTEDDVLHKLPQH